MPLISPADPAVVPPADQRGAPVRGQRHARAEVAVVDALVGRDELALLGPGYGQGPG